MGGGTLCLASPSSQRIMVFNCITLTSVPIASSLIQVSLPPPYEDICDYIG